MSLETLLEAAEFLESRGKDLVPTRNRYERRNSIEDEETNSNNDESNTPETDEATFRGSKEKNRTGKTPESNFPGNITDGFVMRAGTREVHNKLEKNRRAHLKECFDFLKKNIPCLEDKRTSNLGILRSSLRYIQILKRKEREFELEMQRFAHKKIVLQNRMQNLKNDLNSLNIEVDINVWTSTQENDNDTNSTSTATERGTPPPSDHDEHDDDEEEAENLVMETNTSPTPKSKSKKGSKETTSQFQKHSNHDKDPAHANGLFSKPKPPVGVNSPSKKTITLSMTGPVARGHVIGGKFRPAQVTNPSGKLSEIPLSRLPVTQILHRTLTQRQALMKQASMPQVSTAPLTAAQLKSPPLTIPVVHETIVPTTVSKNLTFNSLQLLPSTVTGIQNSRTSTTGSVSLLNNLQVSKATNGNLPIGNLPISVPYYMASMQKISHPILVTSLMAPAIGLTSTASPASSTPGVSSINLSTSGIPIKSQPKASVRSENVPLTASTTVNYITTPILSPAISQTSSTVSNNFPVRPIFAPNLIAGQVAWPFLTVPRPSMVPTTSSTSGHISTSLQSNSSQVTSMPIVSLAQLNQLTQMMAPVTVMSPNIQVTPSQLNSMMASPLLKQFQFPLGISSSLLQTGQVLGQQMVKPVVMVSIPNMVSQSSEVTALPSSGTVVTKST